MEIGQSPSPPGSHPVASAMRAAATHRSQPAHATCRFSASVPLVSRVCFGALGPERLDARTHMPQTSPTSTEWDELNALAQRGASAPSSLDASEIARVCAALLQCFEDADEIILQSRWRDPGSIMRR